MVLRRLHLILHSQDNAVDNMLKIDADAITGAKIADDAIDTEHYADASLEFAHMQNVAANSILGRNANSSGVLSEVALATTQILIGDGTGFTAAALSGDVTMDNAGAVTIASNAVEQAMLADDVVSGAEMKTLRTFTLKDSSRYHIIYNVRSRCSHLGKHYGSSHSAKNSR